MIAFGMSILLSLVVSSVVMYVLGRSLGDVLTEICGTETRGRFWLTFTGVMLYLTPLLAVILFGVASEGTKWAFDAAFLRQTVGCILAGLFVALLGVGWQISQLLPTDFRRGKSGDENEFWGEQR